VDLLVEVRRPMGLFGLVEIQSYLEGLLGRRVDLVTRQALRPRLRERVLREAIPVAVAGTAPW
jgi:predicted nucleotidyltransferase